jgi:isocitrate dehydrogenase
MYWAQELASQTEDEELASAFTDLAEKLRAEEETIVDELNRIQGGPVDIGGYYWVDRDATTAAMRPSATLNEALEAFSV